MYTNTTNALPCAHSVIVYWYIEVPDEFECDLPVLRSKQSYGP